VSSPQARTAPRQLPPAENELLFFLHVPKTAGISLTAVLGANFVPGAILAASDWTKAGEVIEGVRGMSTVERARVRCVCGHYWFGPGDGAVHDHFSIDPIVLTVLRDPVARTASAHQHVMRWPEHWLRKELGIGEDGTISLHDFVEHPGAQGEIANLQTRLVVGAVPGNPFLGDPDPEEAVPFTDGELLEIAKQRLDSFAWIGLTERMEESVRLLTARMGWAPVEELPSLNLNPVPSAEVELAAETRAAILDRTALDAELYAYASERLERELAGQVGGGEG
jgi:hypothetical protein